STTENALAANGVAFGRRFVADLTNFGACRQFEGGVEAGILADDRIQHGIIAASEIHGAEHALGAVGRQLVRSERGRERLWSLLPDEKRPDDGPRVVGVFSVGERLGRGGGPLFEVDLRESSGGPEANRRG